MHKFLYILLVMFASVLTSCKKLIEIDPPKNTITTEQLFSDNAQAEWAIAGVYSKMIHGASDVFVATASEANFAAGLSTVLGSFSSDEMYDSRGPLAGDLYFLSVNKLTTQRAQLTAEAWRSAYKTIYDANAVIEGLAVSSAVIDSVKNQLRGEALALRAFSYFYLVNFFGDVPLALTIDYAATITLPRAPVATVYAQITKDLLEAQSLLAKDFSVGKEERVRVNAWFAEALLARVYLYTGKYQDAVNSATRVINKSDYFILEQDLATVFSANSREAIFQLKPSTEDLGLGNAVPEGYFFRPRGAGLPVTYRFTNEFLSSFEPGDKRMTTWMANDAGSLSPYKYTIGSVEAAQYAPQPQYYTVMRLAEQYLIRAEAALLVSESNKSAAIDDLNALRRRANVGELPDNLTTEQIKNAIANERRFELFAEWGHRWFDLKRTGKASAVLPQMTAKQPWAGNYQLLYPIPAIELATNSKLIQNPEYNRQ